IAGAPAAAGDVAALARALRREGDRDDSAVFADRLRWIQDPTDYEATGDWYRDLLRLFARQFADRLGLRAEIDPRGLPAAARAAARRRPRRPCGPAAPRWTPSASRPRPRNGPRRSGTGSFAGKRCSSTACPCASTWSPDGP